MASAAHSLARKGIYAVGRLELAELFPNEDESVRKALIETKIFIAYQRQLTNLSIQETRLRRQREKDTAGLRELQETRKRAEKAAKPVSKPAPKLGSFLQPAEIECEELDWEDDSSVACNPEHRCKSAA